MTQPMGEKLNKHALPKPDRPWRVAAVCPCFNRPQDLEILLQDFAKLELPGIDLVVVIVDNASTKVLSTLRRPPGLRVDFVRSEVNTGGSGGFNLGMSYILSGAGIVGEMGEPDFIWWVDSDARVGRRSLKELVRVLARDKRVGAVGAAMGEIATAQIWEAGGRIFKKRGTFGPAARDDFDRRALIKCHYVAACCALVRADAVRKTGLFPENFIYYDDIDWCVQMTRATGLKCRATRKARAFHPPGIRRFATWGRYYIARNAFSVLEMRGCGAFTRFRRAMFELPRAAAQTMMGLDELAQLHVRGLQDAAAGNFVKIEPKDILPPIGMKPYKDFVAEVNDAVAAAGPGTQLYVHPLLHTNMPAFEPFRKELRKLTFTWPSNWKKWRKRQQGGHVIRDVMGAAWRALTGPSAAVAIVPTGWPTNWFRGKVMFQVTADGYIVRQPRPLNVILKTVRLYAHGIVAALRLGAKSPGIRPFPPAPAWNPQSVVNVSKPTQQTEAKVLTPAGV